MPVFRGHKSAACSPSADRAAGQEARAPNPYGPRTSPSGVACSSMPLRFQHLFHSLELPPRATPGRDIPPRWGIIPHSRRPDSAPDRHTFEACVRRRPNACSASLIGPFVRWNPRGMARGQTSAAIMALLVLPDFASGSSHGFRQKMFHAEASARQQPARTRSVDLPRPRFAEAIPRPLEGEAGGKTAHRIQCRRGAQAEETHPVRGLVRGLPEPAHVHLREGPRGRLALRGLPVT